MDYLQQYDTETYIFGTVHKRFVEQGFINAYDFFCIIIWKANRAKTKIAARLLKHSHFENLNDAVYTLTNGISKKTSSKEKLQYLLEEWGFLLPMASAILTVLYPDEFTVYDVRVCDELGDFHKLNNLSKFENIWIGYLTYKQRLEEMTPKGLALRDKDRYLWGESFSKQLENDIKSRFGVIK